jgi:tRNA (cmo5U34)-methyltransferase
VAPELAEPVCGHQEGNTVHHVGDRIEVGNAAWSFGGDVSQTFDSHVRRSVPMYEEGHDLVARLSDFFLYGGAVAYELGCSTGELTRKLAERNRHKDVTIIGIDCEPAMVERAKAKCADHPNVSIELGDIVDTEFQTADLIVAYYTMQFIRPRFRQQVFDRIYNALNWGGAFMLFEKVRGPDARFQDMMSAIYNDFKLAQGFSEAEIVHKTCSLKGVLEPFSTQGNLGLLERAGFVDCMTVFKYIPFEGFLAIK